MPGTLSGIRVVDFTEYIAGPYCGMMLADMGADVIKIERPEGDPWRHTAPVAPYEGRGFLAVNRGKRSIALDLAKPEGRAIAHELVSAADVVTANYRPGVAKRLGLDYETLSRENERLVYCENSAFGTNGPYQGRPGYDILSQAMTGIILYENKIERGAPQPVYATAIADLTTGMFMAYAVVNALLARERTGRGQRVETSLFASGLAAQYRPLLSIEAHDAALRDAFLDELNAAREKGVTYDEALTIRSHYVPIRGRNNYYRVYESKDGLIAVACLNNGQRRRMRDALGVADPTVEGMSYDWFSEEVRRTHRETIALYEEAYRARTTAELLALLDAADVPCGPVNFPEEMHTNPHVEANDLIRRLEHGVLGPLRMPACPVEMSDNETGAYTAPPVLGADGPDVLRELGYDAGAIARLLDEGVLSTRERLLENDSGG